MRGLRFSGFRTFVHQLPYSVFVIFSILIMSCSRVHLIPPETDAGKIDEINNKLANVKARIILTPGKQQIDASNVRIAADSVYYSDPKSNGEKALAASKVHRIVKIDRSKGTVEGLWAGFLTGAGIAGTATLLALTTGDDDSESGGYGSGILIAGGIAVGGGALLIGPLIGAARGSWDIYELNADDESPKGEQ